MSKIIGGTTATPMKITAINQESQAINSLKYYGDINIVPSDASLFEFTFPSPIGDGAAIEHLANTLPNELVIPYEAIIDGVAYPVTFLWDMFATFRRDITKLVIPSTVQEIGISAFEGCTEITSIVIPDSVTRINTDAFFGCQGLEDIYYSGTKAQWDAITIGAGNSELRKDRANIHYKWSDVTKEDIGDINTALEHIISIQNSLIGGDTE